MKIEVNEKFRFASVWLTNEEKMDQNFRDSLQPLIQTFKDKKYKFVIFESGKGDLMKYTKSLLSHNKNPVRTENE